MLSHEEATSRCWAEIDLTQLVKNYHNALNHLSDQTRLICVLKADAYGTGAPVVAERLWREGQRFFAVASYNEAKEIKQVLPDCDILILGLCGEVQVRLAIASQMILTVFSAEYASLVVQAAKKVGQKARIHVKVETGLHRLGIQPQEAVDVVQKIIQSDMISLEGLFTHLALRNTQSDRMQINSLLSCRDDLEKRGIRIPILHALDSIGMVRYPDDHFDAVRTGAWLYGVYPKRYEHPEESQLVMKVKTRIAQIHHVNKGECLGYDEDHPLCRDSVIATLSAGYIDGYPRQNNIGEVEICGKRAPVVGLVCMDQMMVDITDIPEAEAGQEVILLGGTIGVDEYATWGKLNRNEALGRTGKRVPRIYFDGGCIVRIVEGLAGGGAI